MLKSEIISIALACIVSAGGTAGIIVAMVKFTSGQIAESLQKKYQLKLNEELETHKTVLGEKEYVSKVRFDKEFEIFGELTKSFFELVASVDSLYPLGLVQKQYQSHDEEMKTLSEQYNFAVSKMNVALDVLNKNAAFIKKEHYASFDHLHQKCREQINYFHMEHFRKNWSIPEEVDPYKNTHGINDEWFKLVDVIRDYLAGLEAI